MHIVIKTNLDVLPIAMPLYLFGNEIYGSIIIENIAGKKAKLRQHCMVILATA
jgi:hypothetical protein